MNSPFTRRTIAGHDVRSRESMLRFKRTAKGVSIVACLCTMLAMVTFICVTSHALN
jgi:hypothetical protein